MTCDELDLRRLAAPEPMVRALEAADRLAPGEAVAVLTPMLPRPLLMELAAMGFEAEPDAAAADGSVRVVIRRPVDGEAQA
ncbi:MAG TPA: DUF2249 domain-containing protein [Rhodanobacter sp.]|nr:DUF2249 domain-containing protein [Rhodanobacter sp.]